jgi:hypothetical protein
MPGNSTTFKKLTSILEHTRSDWSRVIDDLPSDIKLSEGKLRGLEVRYLLLNMEADTLFDLARYFQKKKTSLFFSKATPSERAVRLFNGWFKEHENIFDHCPSVQRKLEPQAKDGQLNLNFHKDFWKPMDSLKDKMDLNEFWNSGKAEWKIWK